METPLPAKYKPSAKDAANLENNFVYHPPKPDQLPRYTLIRDAAKAFATLLVENCPPSRELSVALTHLETCVMFANSSIARGE
jgi:hypothetical protein